MTPWTPESAAPPWPRLDPVAFYGLPGQIVTTIEPHTESDAAALLISYLVAFGNAVGSRAYTVADGAEHRARLFAVIVGETAKARKGTSWRNIRRLFEVADPEWVEKCVTGGLATGEGLISAVKDPHPEKRLLSIEEEFARVLVTSNRGNNTLTEIAREAWDNGNLRTLTRRPMLATGAHVSVLGHITVPELQARLSFVHRVSGFANRFIYICARRSKLLPSGGDLSDTARRQLGIATLAMLTEAREIGEMYRSDEANRMWAELYIAMDRDQPPGDLGPLTARAEAHLLRLSMLYALTDGSTTIGIDHLRAAWALWRYSRDSLDFLFQFGDERALKLYLAIKKSEKGLTGDEQLAVFSRNVSAADIQQARAYLEARGLVATERVATATKPRTVTIARA